MRCLLPDMSGAGAGEPAPPRAATQADVGCSERERFLLELEFVQCLASPAYLHWLAQTRRFDDPAFVAYLRYLRYWQTPPYTKYIL